MIKQGEKTIKHNIKSIYDFDKRYGQRARRTMMRAIKGDISISEGAKLIHRSRKFIYYWTRKSFFK